MRKLIIIAGCACLAACVLARPKQKFVSTATGSLTSGTGTVANISGYIDEIVMELPTAGTSATIVVSVVQPMGNTIVMASNDITATTFTRPRVSETTITGAAVAVTNAAGRYLSYGDTWKIKVTSATPTTKVWRAWIKYDDGR